MSQTGAQVAVIGAGPGGLSATKYLKEEGFRVTCFDRRSDVGGLWAFSEDPSITSTTMRTTAQLSKFASSFSDFPFPRDYPMHVTAPLWSEYFKSYAKHFNLYENMVFGVCVKAIKKSQDGVKWLISLEGEESPREFDKVIMATGTEVVAEHPKIEALERLEGKYMHGQAYKGPESFKGQNVIVVGMGNSAADAACELVGHASHVYLAHRSGTNVLSRMTSKGIPIDAVRTWTTGRILYWIEYYLPSIYGKIVDGIFRKLSREAWGDPLPEWGFQPAPSATVSARAFCINDELIPLLLEGKIASVPDVHKVTGPRSVELTNGKVIEDVDAIIACTGYRGNVSIVEGIPATVTFPNVPAQLDLYMNIFPVDHADTIAFLNRAIISENAGTVRELMAMAIAQIWAGKSKLPPRKEMIAWIGAEQRDWAKKTLTYPKQLECKVRGWQFQRFLHEAAGTGMFENLGWSLDAWKFWWTDRQLYKLVAHGVYNNHYFALFETGKRKAWPGARDAIIETNIEFAQVRDKNSKVAKAA